MGREQKRKQQKKNARKIKEVEDVSLFTFSSFIKTTIALLLVIFFSYFILAFFVTKEYNFGTNNKDKNENADSSSSVSNLIVASNIFDQSENSYYVYFYDFNNEDERISSSISNISDVVYRVNTASGFNSKYVTDGSGNINAKTLDDLKVKAPTLIKIDNDTISSYYEGVNGIINALNK